ncbi:MAG: flagellar export protein FliJ [Phycisphaerae bacterium]|nr:flagellar export protein FliJ [Phycisphaerae bacterium]
MAKRYTFRLEPLLRLRQQREDEQKRVVASRLREIATLQQRREVLHVRIGSQMQAMRESLTSEQVNVDALKLGRHWLIRLRRGVLEADAQISAQRAILAQDRAVLANARRDTKVLQRLRERQRAAHMAEVNRREQTELDEMNVLRFAHAGIVEEE